VAVAESVGASPSPLPTRSRRRSLTKPHLEDVAQLPTAPAFRDVRVVREREGDGEHVTVIVPRVTAIAPAGGPPRRPGAPGPQITWYLPGRVREANRGAVVSGDRVTWSLSLDDYLAEPSVDLSVRYDTAADTR
jgi:hypothetical protein